MATTEEEKLPVQPQGGKPPADRLLAVVRQEAIQKMQRVPEDKINVWPHLIAAEFVSLLLCTALLLDLLAHDCGIPVTPDGTDARAGGPQCAPPRRVLPGGTR